MTLPSGGAGRVSSQVAPPTTARNRDTTQAVPTPTVRTARPTTAAPVPSPRGVSGVPAVEVPRQTVRENAAVGVAVPQHRAVAPTPTVAGPLRRPDARSVDLDSSRGGYYEMKPFVGRGSPLRESDVR